MLSRFFFLNIDLYFLIPAVVAQIFNPIAELVIPIGTSTKEAKEEKKKHPLIVEAKIRKCVCVCFFFFSLFTHQFISTYFFN